ncbi:Uncharacterized protein C11G11.07 [Wickerhamiella sorbophila]|uniref:Uncharacterized protein C11G11.07 n=1 Tax=Wickerhamiella sorbophila TaxID=45607 RepID=A0A2T0FL66_9ASCO|nr:Uncharacterized protein C11G11.07 [Wickerhamiella sorbophila]PRT55734.1 Uncharacterized protein C11G11.07 [Wickerhamiella sorbophila]
MSSAQFAEALNGLLNDPARRAEWNQWLQAFQRKPQAWEACYNVIGSSETSAQVKIFAAQTLRTKVSLDLHQVPHNQLMHLKQQFMTLLMQNCSTTPQVATQLCLALATLAIQLPEWTNVAEEMISALGSDDTIIILYEFLRVFPDEIQSPRYKLTSEEMLKARELAEVKNPAPRVIEYIISTYQTLVAKSKVRLVFEALASWIRQVDVSYVVNSPVVDWVLESLLRSDLSEVAAECLVAIIRGSGNIHKPDGHRDADLLAQKILSLDWSSILASPDVLDQNNSMIIFSAMVETWHVLVVRYGGIYHKIFEIFAQILTLPTDDTELVQHSFEPMEKIKTLVTMPNFDSSKEPWPQFGLKLTQAYLKYLEYPEGDADSDLFEGDRSEEEAFRMSRYEISDMLKICCSLAGPTTISKHLAEHLGMLVKSSVPIESGWQKIEACLFAIRSIARMVPLEDRSIVEVMRLLQQAGNSVKVLHAAVLIVGRYSSWTVAHSDTLIVQLELLEKAFAYNDRTVLKACGHAVMYMGYDCGELMAQYSVPLIEKYRAYIDVFDTETMQSMATGIGQILSVQPYETIKAGIFMFSEPIMTRVLQCNANPSAVTEADLVRINVELDGLASFIATFSADNGALPPKMRYVHPLNEFVAGTCDAFINFGQVFAPQSRDALVGLCKIYSNLTSVCVGNIPQLTPRILEVVANAGQHFVEPVVYEYSGVVLRTFKLMQDGHPEDGASEIVSPELMDQIYQYTKVVSDILFAKLSSTASIQDVFPALLEQGILYLSDVLVALPNEMTADGQFEHAYKLAVQCLTCENFEVLSAVRDFYHEVVHYTRYWNETSVPPTSVGLKCAEAMGKYSQETLSNIFEGYLYYYYDFTSGANYIVDSIVGVVGPDILKVLTGLLEKIDSESVSEQEKQALLTRVNTKISNNGRGSGSQINSFLQTFKARAILPR